MAQAEVIDITSRRKLLGAIAAAPVMAVPQVDAFQDDDPDYELVRLGAECMLSLRDWSNCGDELEAYCQQRYWDHLRRFHAMKATTVAGLAMQLRVQFMDQCGNPWNAEAALTLELTEEQFEEIDGLDMQIFRLAQAANRVAASGRA